MISIWQIQLENFSQLEGDGSPAKKRSKKCFPFPVDLELEHVLGSMPRKVTKSVRWEFKRVMGV
jgi:hypothetical protein